MSAIFHQILSRRRHLIAILVAVIVLMPVLITAMPPLVDYPNHMVRFWLLSGGAKHPPVSTFFAVDWGHSATNIAMDAFAAIVGTLFPAPVVGRIVLGLAAILPPLGAALVSRQVHGRWSWWHILMGLTAWPLVLLTGFMSLQLAFGGALLAAYADIRLAGQVWPWRLARQVTQGLAIILVHPFGLLLYCILVGGIAIGNDIDALRTQWLAIGKRLLAAALPVVLAAAMMALRIAVFGQGDDAADGASLPLPSWDGIPGIENLIQAVVGPLRSYNLAADWLFVVLLWLPIGVAAVLKRLRLHAGLAIAGLAVFIISVVAPQGIGSTSMVDVRLWTMALLVLPIAVLPELVIGKRSLVAFCGAAMCVVAARSAWLTTIWQERQADVRSLYRALDHLPEGARLLPAAIAADDDIPEPVGRNLGGMTPTYGHLATLAVMRRQAYVPTVFAQPGKQPLRVLAPYDDHHEISGGLVATLDDLRTENGSVDGFLPGWRTRFDYVLVVNGDMDRAPAGIAGTCLVDDEGFARLYRIGC